MIAWVCFEWNYLDEDLVAIVFYALEIYWGWYEVEGFEFVLEGLFEIKERLFILEGVEIVEEDVHHVFWLLKIVYWFFSTYLSDRSVSASLA